MESLNLSDIFGIKQELEILDAEFAAKVESEKADNSSMENIWQLQLGFIEKNADALILISE